jgi:hypothetical protein
VRWDDATPSAHFEPLCPRGMAPTAVQVIGTLRAPSRPAPNLLLAPAAEWMESLTL